MRVLTALRLHDENGRNEPFSLIIAAQILTTEPLDKWLKKSYNTTNKNATKRKLDG